MPVVLLIHFMFIIFGTRINTAGEDNVPGPESDDFKPGVLVFFFIHSASLSSAGISNEYTPLFGVIASPLTVTLLAA